MNLSPQPSPDTPLVRTKVIVNGAAGGGRCQERATETLDALSQLSELDVTYTERPGHASELAARAYASGTRQFLSVGGDGTSYEVLNGLFPAASNGPRDVDDVPRLGILPLGTGNSFLRDFDITDQESAVAALKRGRTRRVDVVRVTHSEGVRHYMNLLTIGFVTKAGDLTNRRFKRVGEAGYMMSALIELARLKHEAYPIRVDDGPAERVPSSFLCFSNSQYTGGSLRIAPHADPTDGKVDLIRAGEMKKREFVKELFRVFEGRHVLCEKVDERRARRIEFLEPREELVMLDGEIERLTIHSLEVLPGALEIFA